MRRILPILLGLILIVGCARKQEGPNTITLWHWMVDRQNALEQLAAQYELETGIKVKIDLFAPPEAYTQRVIASSQARALPDIFGILDKKQIFATFIENGFIADLTDEFKKNNSEWESSLFPKALEVNVFTPGNIYNIKPGIYGVPIDVTNIQMLYNKALLEKAGISKAPKTFDEFLSNIDALNRIGVTGLVSGWGETWLTDCFASNYAFNIMGEDKIMATYRGEVSYTDPDWLKVFELFRTLSQKKALAEGIVTKPNKDAEQDFALQRAAFAFNGSWSVNVYNDMNPNLQYGVMLPPAINPQLPMRIWGGAGSSFVVNGHSPKKDKAIAFLKWLTAKKQQVFLSTATRNLPANREALASIPENLADFAKGMDFTTHPTIWPINEEPVVIEAFDKGIQAIVIGEKTPQQVAKEVQTVKEREMAKKARK